MTNEMQTHDRPRVLLVDPNLDSQQLIAGLLDTHYQVVGAQSLAEADEFLRGELPVVLLIELEVPDGDGIAWIGGLRASAAHHDLAIACVTSRSSVQDKVNSMLAGVDDYLVKPVMQETFLTKIRLMLRIRQLRYNRP